MFSFASLIFNLIFLKVFDILNIYSIKLKIKNVCIVKIPHLPIHTQTLTCILTHIEICKPQAYMLCLHTHLHASAHLRTHKMIGPIISFAEICNWWWETFRKIVNKRFEKKKTMQWTNWIGTLGQRIRPVCFIWISIVIRAYKKGALGTNELNVFFPGSANSFHDKRLSLDAFLDCK